MKAHVKTPYGIYPIGGSVDGRNQMPAHGDTANFLAKEQRVEITERKRAAVTTYADS